MIQKINSLIPLLIFISNTSLFQCSSIINSSASNVYSIGAEVLLSSESMCIDSLSISLYQPSAFFIPELDGQNEIGSNPTEDSLEFHPNQKIIYLQEWHNCKYLKTGILPFSKHIEIEVSNVRIRENFLYAESPGIISINSYGRNSLNYGYKLQSL